MTKEEFYNYYAGVSASISSDTDFAAMMENMWHLEEDKKETTLAKLKTLTGEGRKRKKMREKAMKKKSQAAFTTAPRR